MRKFLKRQHHVLLISVLYTCHHVRKQKKRDVTPDNHLNLAWAPELFVAILQVLSVFSSRMIVPPVNEGK